jgi:glycosyltransferase involved in cell wall biosynthesis
VNDPAIPSAKPAVAVIIPTRNRKELLERAIASALRQTVAVQILVMDDGSTDGTEQLVRERYPAAHYQRVETPIGPACQRNRGAEATTAPYLLTLDDDCILQSPATLAQTLALFGHPRVAAVAIPFVNLLEDQRVRIAAPDSQRLWVTYKFWGGMVCFRRDAYLRAGGYREYLYMHVEEPDLAMRLLGAGYVIRLSTVDAIHHYESPLRDHVRLDMLGPRNHILFSWYNVPMPYAPIHLAGTAALTFKHGLKSRSPIGAVHGLYRGFSGILHEISQRRPVSRQTYRLARKLKKRGWLPMAEVEPLLPPIEP